MASSPLPSDPYEALGISKDADLSVVRSAHRKLALKHHPDRIKDEAQREKGKDEFQKIQQAYEILSDPQRRQRYDDQVRLAELRKEAMMRGPPPPTASTTRVYPMRPGPQPAPPQAREYNEHGNFFEEVRQPRDAYEYRDPYDEQPPRANSRKHADYEKRAPPPPPKSSEKSKKPSGTSGVWPGMAAAVAASKFKAQAEKIRNSKADEKRSDKEKRRERNEKAETRKPANFNNTDSDSDYTEIRPSTKPARSKTTSYFDRPTERPRTSPRTEKARDIGEESFDEKWERHHEESKAYMAKATNRPSLDRTGSDAYQYWVGSESKGGGRKSGSDNEKRPGSSKGRRSNTDDYFAPSFNKSSSPSTLRAHVEERIPSRPTTRERERERERDRERERERDRDREHGDHRRMMPGLHRSQTTPAPKSSSSRKDTAPTKGSNLKHGETHMHDSGYGSSSSPHTPEMREESPPRTTKSRYPSTTSTKYQIVDPEPNVDDHGRTPRVREIYDDYGDRPGRRYHSPEPITVEPPRESERRKEKPERPRVDTKKSSRGAAMMQDFIPPRDSGRHEDRPSPRSPRDTPPISRNNSGREKLFAEVSPDEREPSRYARPYPADKVHVASRGEPQYSRYEYREPDDRSRFREAPRMTSRRPSVNAY